MVIMHASSSVGNNSVIYMYVSNDFRQNLHIHFRFFSRHLRHNWLCQHLYLLSDIHLYRHNKQNSTLIKVWFSLVKFEDLDICPKSGRSMLEYEECNVQKFVTETSPNLNTTKAVAGKCDLSGLTCKPGCKVMCIRQDDLAFCHLRNTENRVISVN